MVLQLVFWLLIFTVFYSYAGYGIFLFLIVKYPALGKLFPKPKNKKASTFAVPEGVPYYPTISMIISASGERKEVIEEKIRNTYSLKYPREKLEVIFAIAYDGSSEYDETVHEFYRTFLEEPHYNISSKDEEVFIKFIDVENTEDVRSPEFLDEISQRLASEQFHSGEISDGAKSILDAKMRGEDQDEITVYVTKDIERKGKIAQVNRTVKTAHGEILVFSDANAMFNEDALVNISRHFSDSQVGVVAGEKRVKKGENSTSGEGEGLYWKYESFLKKLDSKLYSAVGAAGEIFAIRKSLWNSEIYPNAIIEDFVISMQVAMDGYRIVYEPDSYAEEEPTFDLQSEFIRRRRIAAGGFQSVVWLKGLLNPFKYGVLTFQYVSHRVLRWVVVPFILPVILLLNVLILFHAAKAVLAFYALVLLMQIGFYGLALIGYRLELQRKKIKIFYFPFLLVMMNYAAYSGLKRYLLKEQKVTWEKVRR
jgi:cellulose synthase/poly-beta-1,6-N-acetylglucosamine synthase-like glycosyltransferase